VLRLAKVIRKTVLMQLFLLPAIFVHYLT